jgi:putative membrane protein
VSAPVGWRRLHPLSPVLRSGKVILGVMAAMTPQALSEGTTSYVGWTLAVFIPVFTIGAFLSWRRTRFTVEGGDLRVESGVLLHRSRRVPLARIQAIDVVRPLLGRALGLAELRLEVVGAGQAEAPLAYLRESEAAALRLDLLALSRGESTDDAVAAHHRPLVSVPTGALIGSMLLDARTALPLVMLVAMVAGALLLPAAALAALTATMLATAITAFEVTRRRLLAEWGFTVSESSDGLVLQHGLTETRSQTVPEGRVQGVRIVAPLLWRSRGWVRVEIDVAGYGGRETLQTSTLLPVAPRELAEALVSRVLGGLPALALLTPPRRARWLSPLALPVLGVGYDDRFVMTRTGWLRHETAVVPLAKVQGFRWEQGPLQRRLRLATLRLATAGHDIHAVALHRDAHEARALLDVLSASARAQRRLVTNRR